VFENKKSNLGAILLAILCLGLATLACSGGGVTVTIVDPASGATVSVGEAVPIKSRATADDGVARVDLSAGGVFVAATSPPGGSTPSDFLVEQSWTPMAAGQVTISVVAYDTNGEASEAASIQLNVISSSGEGPGPGPAASSTPVEDVEMSGGCTLNSWFSGETIPDDTVMMPGQAFVKSWTIQNSGTCDWTSFNLVFISGDQMGGETSVAVPSLAAGSTTEMSVHLTAPSTPGTYRGNWRVQSDEGTFFGSTFFVQIVVPEPATETPPPPTNTPEPAVTPVTVDIVADADSFWWPTNIMCMVGTCPDPGHDPVLDVATSSIPGDMPIITVGMIVVHFDLSTIPDGATIQEATLNLYLDSYDGLAGDMSLNARLASSPWSEDDHSIKPACETSGGTSRAVGIGTAWYNWDVTDLVEQQYASPTTNYGFCLSGGEPGESRTFRSREGSLTSRPYLRVTYLP